MLEQAKLMWKEMGDEVRQDFGEDYFEYKIRSMPEHNVSPVSIVLNPLKKYLLYLTILLVWNISLHVAHCKKTTTFCRIISLNKFQNKISYVLNHPIILVLLKTDKISRSL